MDNFILTGCTLINSTFLSSFRNASISTNVQLTILAVIITDLVIKDSNCNSAACLIYLTTTNFGNYEGGPYKNSKILLTNMRI